MILRTLLSWQYINRIVIIPGCINYSFMIDINKRNGTDREYLLDELLYKSRFVIKRTNVWLNPFKAILVRFETNKIHWKALNILTFIIILLHKL